MRRNYKKLICAMLTVVMMLAALPMSISAGAVYCNKGDIIEFGSYPQNEVKDAVFIAELESQELNWNSYNYYSGNNNMGEMVAGDWMQYTDVEYNGEKYRCVNFTQYRPVRTYNESSAKNSNQDDNGYKLNTNYWFQFAPIKWKVLDVESGLMIPLSVLDSQAFNNNYYLDGSMNNDPDDYHCANEYATSSLRTWLNEVFYFDAFNEEEQSEIKNAVYDGEETTDKVFLLSAEDANNAALGFTDNGKRQAAATAYARCQGATSGYSRWSLRDVGFNANYSYQVARKGSVDHFGMVSHTDGGVRPAVQINMQEPPHVHSYEQTVVEPTCTETGAIYNICSGCGDTQVTTLPAIGHVDADDDGICDVCETVVDATKTCTHICHKGGIHAFFYKIALMFWKLFKTNKYCSCGAAHY